MTTTNEPFESWAVLEIMGHRRIAGYVSERMIGGKPMLKIEVPKGNDITVTTYCSAESVFSLTPCDEADAVAAAKTIGGGFNEQPRLGFIDHNVLGDPGFHDEFYGDHGEDTH